MSNMSVRAFKETKSFLVTKLDVSTLNLILFSRITW